MIAKSICVYCGSRPGRNPAFTHEADALGRAIAVEGWRLVYGAGDVGLMGATARAAQEAGADTFGVIPTHLLDLEVGKTDLTRFVITETMHERKKVMVMNADAIVVLPGGAGSLDEFFEVLTWRQLGLHGKPIILLSVEDYWAPLSALLDHVVDQGFADASLLGFVETTTSASDTITALRRALS
ncbi:TIGR00730 family Rossman fold protein [Marivita sp.]|uniref:LOG family protein n=1 Tax=Marivita sp. TaxID=2003365 RepID=UPI003F72BD1E